MSTPKESLKQPSADQVTVAIPAFNCAAYLKETLHAVARLTRSRLTFSLSMTAPRIRPAVLHPPRV